MTYPGPSTRQRNLPGHTDEDMLRLEARRGIHAGMLPSNAGPGMDSVSGTEIAAEQSMRGWTSQQPWSHVDCPVMLLCILCNEELDPDYLRSHQCAVRAELEAA